MAAVLDFQTRLAEKREAEAKAAEEQKMMDHMKFLIANLTQGEKIQLLEAIENKDLDAWQRITNPIILRDVIKRFN